MSAPRPASAPGLGSDRRPLAAREIPLWKNLVPRLERAGVSPNAISAAGLVFGLLSGVALAATAARMPGGGAARLLWAAGGIFILLRGACNILDGVLAVETGRASPTGYLWNEFPDRIADVAILLGAGHAAGGDPAAGALAALAAVTTAYTRVLAKVAGASMRFSGPMAKPMRMAVVTAVAFAQAVAPAGWTAPAGGRMGWMAAALWLIAAGGAATIARRLAHAARELEGAAP